MIKIAQEIIVLLIAFIFISQIALPMLFNKPLFWIFKKTKTNKELNNENNELKETPLKEAVKEVKKQSIEDLKDNNVEEKHTILK